MGWSIFVSYPVSGVSKDFDFSKHGNFVDLIFALIILFLKLWTKGKEVIK